MNKFLNSVIALLLPSMGSCNGGKAQTDPEDMYGCPEPDVPLEYEPQPPEVMYGGPVPDEDIIVEWDDSAKDNNNQ